jgi:glycosyltransferase involved in cell wall biosynthesis
VSESVLFFCGQPLVDRPIAQRIGAFAAFLARQGRDVHVSAVDPSFDGAPFVTRDEQHGIDVEIVGPAHYRVDAGGRRFAIPPAEYLRECRRMAARLRSRVTSLRPDHVVLSTTLPASLYAAVALARHRRSVWIDVDDWSAGQLAARGGGGLPAIAYGMLERLLPRVPGHLTVCSRELFSLFPRAEIVPNFIRLDDVPPPASRPSAPVKVAFAGSVTAYHGHEPFLEALARRRSQCSRLEISVIGDGDALPACRAAGAGLGDVVRFTGHVERDTMLRLLRESDIGVIPLQDDRVNRARFPLKLLDYLACGCAIAASNVGTVRHVLTNGRTALLSAPGDMDALVGDVLTLAADGDVRARLAEAGATIVRDYDEDVVCGRWLQVLTDARWAP